MSHILVALTTREQRLFLGGGNETGLPSDSAKWVRPGDAQMADGAWEETLRRWRPTVVLSGWSTPPIPLRWLETGDCPLRYVCHTAGSVRRIVPRSFLSGGGMATNWGRFAGPFVAEHAILLALASLRNLSAWRPFMNLPPDGREVESLGTRSLLGRSVGLHGFGHIARALAGLLRPFGVTLRAFSAGVGDELIRMEGVEPCASLEELFRHSEVLFECEALTATSERAVTAAVLSLLPDGAVFVNVGRGRLVDEAALMRETASGRIRAALDVTTETLAPDSPWLQLPGVILSPHIGGPSHDQYRHCGKMALDNIGRFLRGEPLSGLVTLEIYDRST